MLPLAVTSNNWSIRRMGPQAWQRLHRLTYLAGFAGALHYLVLVKGLAAGADPVYSGALPLLLATRVVPRRAATGQRVGLTGLAAAGCGSKIARSSGSTCGENCANHQIL